MNPAFIILVILGSILLWFLLSFVFIPLGKLVYKVVKDAIDIMNKEDNEKRRKGDKVNEKRKNWWN